MTPQRILRARSRTRGTASVEVVMMLPFFILIYAGIYYMHGHYTGRQQAMLTARTCAWKFAAAGCKDDDKAALQTCLAPKGSSSATDVDVPPEDSPPMAQPPAGSNASPQAQADDDNGGVGDRVAHVLNAIQKIPVLGAAVGWLFGKPVGVTATQVVTLPRPYVANTQQVAVVGHYYTMCNSIPQSWTSLAHDIFCSVLGKGTLGC